MPEQTTGYSRYYGLCENSGHPPLDLRNGFARGLSQAALAAEDRAIPHRSDNTADQRLVGDVLRRLAEHLRVEAGRVVKEAGR